MPRHSGAPQHRFERPGWPRTRSGLAVANYLWAPATSVMGDLSWTMSVKRDFSPAQSRNAIYAHHPAVIASGHDNEIGNRFMSYAGPDRRRFIARPSAAPASIATGPMLRSRRSSGSRGAHDSGMYTGVSQRSPLKPGFRS